MIKHTQSKVSLFNSEGKEVQVGNCWQTTIASLIEYPVHDVPNFEVWFNYKGENSYFYNYFEMTERWLESEGFRLDYANYAGIAYHEEYRKFILENNRYWIDNTIKEEFKEYLKTNTDEELVKFLQDYCKNDIYMVSGDSPRGNNISHVAIFKQGKLIHDVHPSREGIKTFNIFYRITKINE